MTARVIGVAASLLLAGSLVGCDAGKPDGTNERPDAKEQYLDRANAICADLGADTERLAREFFGGLEGPPTPKQQRAYQRRSIEMQREALAELRALPPPEGDEERLDEIYDEFEQVLERLEAAPVSKPPTGDFGIDRFRALARSYGLTECAGG